MILTISQLKEKWNKEKISYLKKELGDGVQKFVKDCLKSFELFNLKDGLISTPLENRRNEFSEESKTKGARKVDIIIYINSEIVIPVEVERHENLDAGLAQIFQYQLDLDKKYGILTDGYHWRFYNNAYLLKEFTLDEIFNDPELFGHFWKEYTKLEFYYLSFFEEKGQLNLFPNDLSVEIKRQDFFKAITTLIRGFKNKLEIEGYFKNLAQKDRKKKAAEITYAYIIQFILYKALVDNAFGKFDSEFKDNVEEIRACLRAKRYGKILGIVEGISNTISTNIYRPFAKEQDYITKTIFELIRKPINELHDVSPWLDIFVFIKNFNFANVKNEIFGYIYENYLKELYEDTQKGQYFTDPAVVNFMLEQVGYTKDKIRKRIENNENENYISLIDPSCGSGTFLYSAVDRLIESIPNGSEESSKKIEGLINKNIFGLDIAEFPLYLAEMNILMRMLPLILNEKYNNPIDKKIKVFKTKDSLSEFQDTALRNTQFDSDTDYEKNKGQLSLFEQKLDLGYVCYVRDEDDLKEMKNSLENVKISRQRFDYVIGNPPYISYNECSKQKMLIFELMKQGKIKLSNIYGVNLHSIPNHQKKYSPKPNLYAFFIALGISLLKENGRLCYIIPQTILTAGDLDVLRYTLAKFTTIEKIVLFSGKMFIGRGLKQNKAVATSSLIIVINKKRPPLTNKLEIINYKDNKDDIQKCLQNILKGVKISKKKLKQKDMLDNVTNWNFIKQDSLILDFIKEYKRKTDDISIYYNHNDADSRFGGRFYFDIGFSLSPKEITTIPLNSYELLDFKNFNGYSNYSALKYYPKDKDKIKLTQNSQGYVTLDQRYKIVWSIKNPDSFHFTDHSIIFYMGKASIICSNIKNDILFLFSILNSQLTKVILLTNLKNENEKEYQVPIKAIKNFVRIPQITQDNQYIKDEIVMRTDEMLVLEEVKFSDLIDFTGIMIQKFDSIEVKNDELILIKDSRETRCKIKKSTNLIKHTILEIITKKKLFYEDKICLSELKNIPVIDFEKQKALKSYIDDLIFALYSNISISKIGIDAANDIKNRFNKNKFYNLILNY